MWTMSILLKLWCLYAFMIILLGFALPRTGIRRKYVYFLLASNFLVEHLGAKSENFSPLKNFFLCLLNE